MLCKTPTRTAYENYPTLLFDLSQKTFADLCKKEIGTILNDVSLFRWKQYIPLSEVEVATSSNSQKSKTEEDRNMSKLDDVKGRWYSFYPRLEKLCEARGINNKTLSIKAEISPATISKWKASYEETYGFWGMFSDRNITVPGVESLIYLSLYFNCSTDYLIGTRVDWKAEQIDRIIGRLSAENKEKLLEHAKLLLLKQEHDKENE